MRVLFMLRPHAYHPIYFSGITPTIDPGLAPGERLTLGMPCIATLFSD